MQGKEETNKTCGRWIPPKETFIFRMVSKVLTLLTSIFVWILLYVMNNTRFYGLNNIKNEKAPFIFASNHTTMFDSAFIDCTVFFKRSLFSYKWLPYHTPEYGNFYKNRLLSWYMDHVKCIPVERGKGIDQFSQKKVTEKLKEGNIVHIFPEGTRSRTGELLEGKAGVGKRVYEAKVKVVPCYHEGMRNMLPVGKTIPEIGKKIRVIIGKPIFFDEYFSMPNTPETWKAIAGKIMNEISSLKQNLQEIEKINDDNKK